MSLTVAPRQRIIDAAIACFARDGFHGASMQQICAEASMSPGALYRYFPSKVSIIAAIAEAERAGHKAFFERLAEADDPVEALASIGIDKLEQILADKSAALGAETLAEALRNPEVRAMVDRNLSEARAAVVQALRRGQGRGQVDPSLDLDTACQLILAMGDGLSVHQGLDPTLTANRFRPTLQLLLRRFLRPGLALFLLAAAPAWAQTGPRPPSVTVVAAETGAIAETVTLNGTLVARDDVWVSPQIDGFVITDILAEEGDRVGAGQVLARLSHEVIDAQIAQNTAQLSRAGAAIAQARSSIEESQATKTQADLALARTRNLVDNNNASRETLEQRIAAARIAVARAEASQSALLLAEADLALAQAQRDELLVRRARADIRAPVAGVVSRRGARLGAIVAGGGEPLFRIIAGGAIELEADAPETQLARLRPGQGAAVETVAGQRAGRVRLVSPEVNRTSRLGRVRVALDDDGNLPLGSFAQAAVTTARNEGVLAPLSAVLFQPDGAVVQVVRDGTVETRPVSVGLRQAGQAEIVSGLKPGETIVATSGAFIRGGDRVIAVAR